MNVNVVKSITLKVKPLAMHICKKVGPKAPVILLGAGIAAIGSGTVIACVKSVKKVPNVIAEKNETIDLIKESADEYEESEQKRAIFETYRDMTIDLAKIYALPVSIITAGVGCIVLSHNIQHARIVALGTAYNTLLGTFNEYRGRVREKEGKDADKEYLYGTHEEVVIEEKEGKDGKVRKKEKSVTVLGSGNSESLYHRCFCRESSWAWTKDIDYNLSYIIGLQRQFNNQLQAEGYVMLDEVYRALGFPLDNYSNAKIVGWKLGNGDDFIDFGIYNPDADIEETLTNLTALKYGNDYDKMPYADMFKDTDIFMNGFNNAIWLDFNCDGVIIDLI